MMAVQLSQFPSSDSRRVSSSVNLFEKITPRQFIATKPELRYLT